MATTLKPGTVLGVSEVALWVDNLSDATEFYVNKLGFTISDAESDPGHNMFLSSGDLVLALFDRSSPNTKLANEYLARTAGPKGDIYHFALRLHPEALDEAAEQIKISGTEVKGPVEFASRRRSYFLEDLDEHYIELTDR